MTIFLIRHAQSQFNAVYDPDKPDPMLFDAPITELGQQQAIRARAEIKFAEGACPDGLCDSRSARARPPHDSRTQGEVGAPTAQPGTVGWPNQPHYAKEPLAVGVPSVECCLLLA